MRNVIVAFPKEETNQKFKSILQQYGYHVLGICSSGNHVLNRAGECQYGIVLTGFRMKDMAWDELREKLPAGFCMILLLPEAKQEAAPGNGKHDTICLTVPFVIRELLQALEAADAETEAVRRRDKSKPKKRTAQEIADIAGAKALLMEQRGMTEAAAHRYLQRRSMESQVSLAECAQKVIRMMTEQKTREDMYVTGE